VGSSNESEIRLAELIWRTVKLRLSLLVLAIVVLLVVWSSLLNGNQEAQKIDTKFCEYLVDNENVVQKKLVEEVNKSLKSGPNVPKSQPPLISAEDVCHIGSSRNWIEITRSTDETMPLETPLAPAAPSLDFITKAANEKKKAFADYDNQRHDAYRLQIQLSSEFSGSTIVVNALSVAKVVPFCVFIVLAVISIFGVQQSAYRRQLRTLIQKRTRDDLSEALAETQFFAVPLDRDRFRPEKYLGVSPLDLAMTALGAALVLLLVGIISTSLLNLVQLTDSIVVSYPFALYASVTLLFGLIVVTRNFYAELTQSEPESQKHDSDWRPSKESKWLTLIFAVIAFASLALPWVVESGEDGNFFKGFRFLLNQRPTGKLFNYQTYAFSPAIFRDARTQVTIAVTFIAVCILDVLFGLRSAKRLPALLHQCRRLLAACVLIISTYIIFYIAYLEYESVYWVPWLDKIQGLQGPANAKGYTMLSYDPAYGFLIFLMCCFLQVWLSFATKTETLDTWVRHLNGAATRTRKTFVEFSKNRGHKSD
jgi:hypothetical protein